MFKIKRFHYYKVIDKTNKPLQSTVFLIGLVLFNNPALAARKQPSSATPTTVIQEQIGNGKEDSCLGQISNPAKLTLPLGKSTLIKLPEPLASRSVGNPNVLQAKLISPKTLYLLGLDIGSTNMIIQSKNGTCTIIDVTVILDPDSLQQNLSELFPEEKNVKVTAASDSLILSGTVEDAITANRIVDIARAYVRRKAQPANVGQSASDGNNQGAKQKEKEDDFDVGLGQYDSRVNFRVINMLSVSAQQQVMLEVKVAEVSKTLLDKLGASLSLSQTSGSWTYRLLTDFLSTAGSATGGAISGFKNADKNFAIDAEKRDGLIKILAEPTIMAISGQEGSFLAGGTIFIPVAQQNNGGGTTITLEEKEFGVGVKFTPTVLAGGRINLRVAPEVSELNKEGVGISATGFSGTAILPSFTTRRASTTVQLLDGQSFAIGGLIKNNTTTNIKAFPILGEIPILGALFRSTEFQKDKTELIFIVTPHLVKPLTNTQVRLPTDRYVDPSRADIFLKGKMEGKLPPDAPPPVVPPVAPDKQSDVTNSEALKPNALELNAPVQANDTGFDVR